MRNIVVGGGLSGMRALRYGEEEIRTPKEVNAKNKDAQHEKGNVVRVFPRAFHRWVARESPDTVGEFHTIPDLDRRPNAIHEG